MEDFSKLIASKLNLSLKEVDRTIVLLEGGATIPFISRYRKEATGGMDEVTIQNIKELNDKLHELQRRKEYIVKTITEQGKMTADLQKRLDETWEENVIEDIYLPYKPKRKTRAEAARQRGLEPLADLLWKQRENNVAAFARRYLTDEVKSVEEAIQGACDIIAEKISEDENARNCVRREFGYSGVFSAKVVKSKEEEADKYRDYFDFAEPLRRVSSHRLLAVRRGEEEGFLKVDISPDADDTLGRLVRMFVHGDSESSHLVEDALRDSYKRLLKPSIETEFAAKSKLKADEEAIRVFAENLKQLLMAAPLGLKPTMGIDPGFRTGCKVVCLDNQGNFLHHDVIFPHHPARHPAQAMEMVNDLIEKYHIEAIAIGNGTASRETQSFVESIPFAKPVRIYVVSEQGASIYSASKVARDEFPDEDVTVRGAVSIARRLMDPLAELVKIDPKSIGVGQYQHDVDQTLLKNSLDRTIEYCVNLVGVNLNTASSYLLTYVSGLGPQLAHNIVDYRSLHGVFTSRKQLMDVPRMGAKAFEQSAGFLRIPQAVNPLDSSAVHPESYHIVEQMARDEQCSVADLVRDKELRARIDVRKYITDEIGLPTLNDIIKELAKPGLDPRDAIHEFHFDSNVHDIEDLVIGMELPGIVTNITDFGAFVDIGIHENGLVHRSQLADRFVQNPLDVVTVHQQIWVKVIDVDLKRNRIALSMKGVEQHQTN
ncbi:MAG: RNA-binding transcriptional accessory protein [Bacteroidales bacterium]|nr:RNA-binding transcriptional accessory protein [Bacteroidales bacterium]